MILSPTRTSRLARWLRLAAACLVAVLVMQALQGAMDLGAGPRHLHRPDGVGQSAQGHVHLDFQRHHHVATDPSLWVVDPADTGSVDAAAAALVMALTLMAFGARPRMAAAVRHVLQAARPWFWRSLDMPPRLRPPRPGDTR
jgi:hypothetical protein